MLPVESIVPYQAKMTKGGELFVQGRRTSDFFPEDMDLMQLVDGDELIWEGDIVEGVVIYGTAGQKFGGKSLKFEVVWYDFGFKLKQLGRLRYFQMSMVPEKTVIGNIYENPELLGVVSAG